MKRKATTAQFDGNKRSRVDQEAEHVEYHDFFPLNDLPDMVFAIIVRLLVSVNFLLLMFLYFNPSYSYFGPVFLGSVMCLPFEG